VLSKFDPNSIPPFTIGNAVKPIEIDSFRSSYPMYADNKLLLLSCAFELVVNKNDIKSANNNGNDFQFKRTFFI
jgi:hypothetical protein